MKRVLIVSIISILFLFCPVSVIAIYDPVSVSNNKFGIHILDVNELEIASKLVNGTSGDWGYVTIPIQNTDKNLDKWQKFLDDCRKFRLIPLIRLATHPNGEVWEKPNSYDLVDFANFLNSLNWPVLNRYVIIFNEPNRAEEWGGEISPQGYAQILSESLEIFKNKNPHFFILNAALDNAAPNAPDFMEAYDFLKKMNQFSPGIFNNLDGWNSHSYPNPHYRAHPYEKRKNSISAYKYEIQFLKNYLQIKDLPVFITETNWSQKEIEPSTIALYFEIAFKDVWVEKNLIAVTPFLLQAGTEPFAQFSFLDLNGKPNEIYFKYQSLKKIKGEPLLEKSPKPSQNPETKEKLPVKQFKSQKVKIDYQSQILLWKSIFKWFLISKN